MAEQDLEAVLEAQRDSSIKWQERRCEEAAAVLDLLINASLMLIPVDATALTYIAQSACFFEVGRSSETVVIASGYSLLFVVLKGSCCPMCGHPENNSRTVLT